MPRGDFVTNYCKQQPNEQRFAFHRDLDKSTYLTKNSRIQTRHFNGYVERSPDLIRKAGDAHYVLEGRPDEFYDVSFKE